MSAAPILSLVVPVFNEEEAIPLFVETVTACLAQILESWEIVFVDDGSRDGTLEVLRREHARNARIKVVAFSRNYGKEVALTAGIDHATGRAVVPMDVDLQDPPELLGEMLAKWREGYDVVLAQRSDRSSDTWLKRKTAGMFYDAMNSLSNIPLPPDVGDFRLMDRRVVDALKLYPERQRFMKGIFASLGFRQTTVQFARSARSAGVTKFNAFKLWNLALEGVVSFSTKPLKIWTYVGSAAAAVAIAYTVYLIVRTLTTGVDVPGYASLMAAVLLMSGLILIGLGIIGEYLARVFHEVKARPLYLVQERLGFSSQSEAAEERVFEWTRATRV